MSAHVGGADEIFTGTLVAIADPPRGLVMTSSDPITYIVAVEGVYRGDVGDTAEFQSAMSGASCGLEGMVVGRRYLVFVSIDGSSRTASLCGGTTLATRGAVQAVERLTGTPMHPEIDGNEEQASAVLASAGRGVGGWQIGASAWAVGVAGFVAAAALVGALSRRRAIVRRDVRGASAERRWDGKPAQGVRRRRASPAGGYQGRRSVPRRVTRAVMPPGPVHR